MSLSFFWYDLETTGINPRDSRVMQFAGQRTELDLQPIGEPVNELIRMTEDVLPEPEAIMLTGITPQMTLSEGISEVKFLELFTKEVAVAGTVFVGFNSVRFDDEFMRFLHYRNFYDPYEWQWRDSRSRWDLLDVIRMTRALRPDGIQWPVDRDGKATNRLELLTTKNNLEHVSAHDALSDVQASIALARLVYQKQPKLFEYLFKMRDKQKVGQLVNSGEPFVFSSGSYSSKFEKTGIAISLGQSEHSQSAIVFDLRFDPLDFKNMTVPELAEAWRYKKERTDQQLPVKVLKFNRCPAIAPLSVLDEPTRERLKLDMDVIEKNKKSIKNMKDFGDKLREAQVLLNQAPQLSVFPDDITDVDTRLYDGFVDEQDKNLMSVVRAAQPQELSSLELPFKDERLRLMLPLYKARNFPRYLSVEERVTWDEFRQQKLLGEGNQSQLAKYFNKLQALSQRSNVTSQQQYLIEELKLYGESITPGYEDI